MAHDTNKLGRHLVEFNSTYMNYQRKKIRELQKLNFALCLVIIVLLIALSGAVFALIAQNNANDKLLENNRILHETINDKNDAIEKEQEKAAKLEAEFYTKVKDAVYSLAGKTVDKAVAVTYFEARNQGEYGMQLVADTIWNRKNSSQFKAGNIDEVLTSPKQFNVLPLVNSINEKDRESPQYLMAEAIIWDKILYNTTASNEVLFFMNPDISNEASRGWMETRNLVVKHKNHAFYS